MFESLQALEQLKPDHIPRLCYAKQENSLNMCLLFKEIHLRTILQWQQTRLMTCFN